MTFKISSRINKQKYVIVSGTSVTIINAMLVFITGKCCRQKKWNIVLIKQS